MAVALRDLAGNLAPAFTNQPSSIALRDLAGNLAPAFTNQPASNGPASQTLTAAGLPPADGIGTPGVASLTQLVAPPSVESVYRPTAWDEHVLWSAATIPWDGKRSAIGSATVAGSLTSPGLSSETATGAPTITTASLSVLPSGTAPGEAPGAPTIAPPPFTLAVAGAAPAEAAGSASLLSLAADLTADGVPADLLIGQTIVTNIGVAILVATGAAPAGAVGLSSLPSGAVSITGLGAEPSGAVGGPALAPFVLLTGLGLSTVSTEGAAIIAASAATITASGVEPFIEVGGAALVVSSVVLVPEGAPTVSTAGVPYVQAATILITIGATPGPGPEGGLGIPTLSSGAAVVLPSGVDPVLVAGLAVVVRVFRDVSLIVGRSNVSVIAGPSKRRWKLGRSVRA